MIGEPTHACPGENSGHELGGEPKPAGKCRRPGIPATNRTTPRRAVCPCSIEPFAETPEPLRKTGFVGWTGAATILVACVVGHACDTREPEKVQAYPPPLEAGRTILTGSEAVKNVSCADNSLD